MATRIHPEVGDVIYESYSPQRPLRVVATTSTVLKCVDLKGNPKILGRGRRYASLSALIDEHVRKAYNLHKVLEAIQKVPTPESLDPEKVKAADDDRFAKLLERKRTDAEG